MRYTPDNRDLLLFAILDDDRNVVPTTGPEWTEQQAREVRQTSFVKGVPVNKNRVAYTKFHASGYDNLEQDAVVSTVFIGINTNPGGKPTWFETAVFTGDDMLWRRSSETWEEATLTHKQIDRALEAQLAGEPVDDEFRVEGLGVEEN